MSTPGRNNGPGGFGRKLVTEFGPFLTLGLQLAISVVAFFFLGRWLDEKFGTAPWLMITGSVLGVVGALISFVRKVTELAKQQDEEAEFRRKKKSDDEA